MDFDLIFVAPHTGAWIETIPSPALIPQPAVAPHTGAWIETQTIWLMQFMRYVAPHTGAWIETRSYREMPHLY